MKNKEIMTKLISGIVFLLIGVLLAIFGGNAVLDIYFGIYALVAAIALIGVAIYQMVKKLDVEFVYLVLGGVFAAVGIGLFADWLSVSVMISFLVLAVMGAGVGLIGVGIYHLVKKNTLLGVLNLVIGVAAVVFAALYIAVDGFRAFFWIIVGIIVGLYGLLQIVLVIVDLNKKK